MAAIQTSSTQHTGGQPGVQPHDAIVREFAAPAVTPLEVDEVNCIVKGVKILGERSINPPPDNNVYPRAVREKAAALLEGCRAHVDHWKDEPSYAQSFGVHRNVRESGNGLLSDVHCNPHHPITKQFLWDAKHNPRNVGFSLNTSATKRWTEDGMVVESINFSPIHHSVDLVHHGATTQSLSESAKAAGAGAGAGAEAGGGTGNQPQTQVRIMKKSIREILVARSKPWQVAAFSVLREAADPYMAAEVPVADASGSETSPDEQAKAAFRAMVLAVWDDETLDWPATIKKIKDIATMQEKLMADSQAAADAVPADAAAADPVTGADAAATESARAALAAAKPDKSGLILAALVAESVVPNKYLTRALAGCETEAEMTETIRDFKSRVKESAAAQTQVVSGGRTSPAASERPVPTNGKEAGRAWTI